MKALTFLLRLRWASLQFGFTIEKCPHLPVLIKATKTTISILLFSFKYLKNCFQCAKGLLHDPCKIALYIQWRWELKPVLLREPRLLLPLGESDKTARGPSRWSAGRPGQEERKYRVSQRGGTTLKRYYS